MRGMEGNLLQKWNVEHGTGIAEKLVTHPNPKTGAKKCWYVPRVLGAVYSRSFLKSVPGESISQIFLPKFYLKTA